MTKPDFVYIKKFEFLDPYLQAQTDGHPLAGRVYRSVYNENTTHYRIDLPTFMPMSFNKLTGMNEQADFEIVPITPENILDFDIREEDLDLMLKDEVVPSTEIDTVLTILQEYANESVKDADDFSDRASKAVLNLWHLNSRKAEILVRIAEMLGEHEIESQHDISYWLRFTDGGMAFNIGEALRELDYYADEEDGESLYEAIKHICTELERIDDNSDL